MLYKTKFILLRKINLTCCAKQNSCVKLDVLCKNIRVAKTNNLDVLCKTELMLKKQSSCFKDE